MKFAWPLSIKMVRRDVKKKIPVNIKSVMFGGVAVGDAGVKTEMVLFKYL